MREVANGEVYEATVSFRRGIGAEAGDSSTSLVVVGVLLVAAVVTLVVLESRDRSRRAAAVKDD